MQLHKIQLNNKVLQLPNFIPSISSIKTNYHPIDYLKLLVTLEYPAYLISAYDVCYSFNSHLNEFNSLLDISNKHNQIIFLDSGNYEYFWNLPFNPWTDSIYYKKLENLKIDFAFSFDGSGIDNSYNSDIICNRILEQEAFSGNSIVIPIIKVSASKLEGIVIDIVKKIDPVILAIPERVLGNGIMERCTTLKKIRNNLNSLGKYYPIHLLGTGNPRSILLYILAGADSFDGLEWCQTFIESKTGLLYHFHQADIFMDCSNSEINYATNIFINNLKYLNNFISNIRKNIEQQTFNILLHDYFEEAFITNLNKVLERNA